MSAMVKMIHALTGTVMYVDERRCEEYLTAGHHLAEKPAPVQEKAEEPTPAQEKAEEPPQAAPSPAGKPAQPAKPAARTAAKKTAPAKKR